MRVYDLCRATEVLRKSIGPETSLGLSARGVMAINATYATILTRAIDRLKLQDPSTTHRHGPYYLNVRKWLDVPQAIALAAESARISIRTSNADAFRFADQVSRLDGNENHLQIHSRKKSENGEK